MMLRRMTWMMTLTTTLALLIPGSAIAIAAGASEEVAGPTVYLPLGLKASAPISEHYFTTLPPGSALPGDA